MKIIFTFPKTLSTIYSLLCIFSTSLFYSSKYNIYTYKIYKRISIIYKILFLTLFSLNSMPQNSFHVKTYNLTSLKLLSKNTFIS